MIMAGTEALVVERFQPGRFGGYPLGYLGYLLGLLLSFFRFGRWWSIVKRDSVEGL
jgi:hypothetical protein